MRLSDIKHENGKHWVLKVKHGYEVYKADTVVHYSTRCAQIGYKGKMGLDRAILECEKREMMKNLSGRDTYHVE